MSIDRSEVERIARLAELELDPGSATALREELGKILDYVARLGELDVGPVEPTLPRSPHHALRDDEPRRSLSAEDALRNAPDGASGFFRVPRVLDG